MLVLLPILSTVLGARTFWVDQQGRHYHFFTEHGVWPRWVWLSRQLVSGSTLFLIAVVACVPLLFTWPREQELPGAALGLAVLMFAAGQAGSIFIRSGIVAVFAAVLCSVLLFGWTMFQHIFGVWWVVSSLPLPFIFWWATWLYAPNWIQERTAWRVRVVTAATILVPLCGVVAATAAYRVYEIPAIVFSFDPVVPQPDDSPAARETAAMYHDADQILRRRLATNQADDSPTISSRDSEWQQGIELFVAASQRESCRFYHWGDEGAGGAFDPGQLTRAVLAEATARIEDGDLEGAAELYAGLLNLAAHFYDQRCETAYRYYGVAAEQQLFAVLPEWANHESLDNQRIKQTLSKLQTWCADNRPDWEASVVEQRRRVKRLIALDDEIMTQFYDMEASERAAFKVIGTLLPWERWRMSRLLDVYTEAELQGIREVQLRAVGMTLQAQRTLHWDVRLDLGNGKQQLIRSTDVEAWLSTTPWLQMTSSLTAPSYAQWEQQYQVRRNAVQLQLALIAWRTEHGQLPESLAQLIGNPFETLPLDPYTDRTFVYFPDGIEEEIWDDGGMGMAMFGMGEVLGDGVTPPKPRIVRSEPFFWSPDWQIRYAPGTVHSPSDSPTADDFRDQRGNALIQQNLLHQGVRYPIPQADQQATDPADNAAALPKAE